MYLTVDEISAVLATLLTSTDERLTAWNALSAADQGVCAQQAHDDLDACLWIGVIEDPQTQGDAWPRIYDRASASTETGTGDTVLPGGEMDLPDGITEWSTLLIPAGIRRAHALQAARRAVRAIGYDEGRQALDAAHAASGGGVRAAWANLDRDAYAAVSGLRRTQGVMV